MIEVQGQSPLALPRTTKNPPDEGIVGRVGGGIYEAEISPFVQWTVQLERVLFHASGLTI